ncbi:hypothetical protein AVEN_214771-1, partial [Araneus ventricosus]
MLETDRTRNKYCRFRKERATISGPYGGDPVPLAEPSPPIDKREVT